MNNKTMSVLVVMITIILLMVINMRFELADIESKLLNYPPMVNDAHTKAHGALTLHDNQVYGMRQIFSIRWGITINDMQAEAILNEIELDVLTKEELIMILQTAGKRTDREWLHMLDKLVEYPDYMYNNKYPMSPDSK